MADSDYYAVLGVLPSAEDVVIRAAYRALAQRYHPDRYVGEARMKEINAAYAVLSDAEKRAAYDASRGQGPSEGSGYFDDDGGDSVPTNDPLEEDWKYSKQFYPDLEGLEARLSKISWRLGFCFRVVLLDTKLFSDRHKIAEAMEKEALTRYFGDDSEINAFALNLIFNGERGAALALNRAISVMGAPSNPSIIISGIIKNHTSDSFKRKYEDPQGGESLSDAGSFTIAIIIAILFILIILASAFK